MSTTQKAPRKTAKPLRTEWPKVRLKKIHGLNYFQVDLRRKGFKGTKRPTFKDKEKALNFAKETAAKVGEHGIKSISNFQLPPEWLAFIQQCKIYGKTIDQAFQVALDQFEKEKGVMESPLIGEAATLWTLDKIENTLKPLRPRSAKSLRQNATLIKKDFGELRIKELTQEKIEAWLTGKNGGNQYKKNLLSYLSQFYNWCISKGHTTVNPTKNIKIAVVQNAPRFLTIEQAKELLQKSGQESHKGLLPYICLTLFAGIRPQEAAFLKWAHIDLENKYITIPAEISKTKKLRAFHMSETLYQWLDHCKALKHLVPPLPPGIKKGNPPDLSRPLRKLVSYGWQQDILRHSFATYHYAQYESLEQLRKIMGNSPDVIDKFYQSPTMKKNVAEFNDLLPSKVLTVETPK